VFIEVVFVNNSDCMFSASEREMEGEDTAGSMSVTETEDYPASADEDDESKEQISSRVRLPGGIDDHA